MDGKKKTQNTHLRSHKLGTNIKKELFRFISEDVQNGDVTSVLLPKNKITAKIPSSLEIILAMIKFFGNNTDVISTLCISSEINRNNSFLISVPNLGYLKCILPLYSYF